MLDQDFRSTPLAYLLTFRSYGTWLVGDPRGSTPNSMSTPLRGPHEGLRRACEQRLAHAPTTFDDAQRIVIHCAIDETCRAKQWAAYAVNVRTNHVHVVLSGPCPPEQMMRTLKAWSSRRLREAGLMAIDHKVWSRHGSTRYLWRQSAVAAACAYTLNQ